MMLQDAANIAQVVGAFAVIASLIFLAIEVRRAGREVLVSSQQAQADAHAGYLLAMATDEGLVALLAKGIRGESLTLVEAAQESLLLSAIFTQFQATFHCATAYGARRTGSWEHMERVLGRWTGFPHVRSWWALDRVLFAEDFRSLVDAKIAAATGDGVGVTTAIPRQ